MKTLSLPVLIFASFLPAAFAPAQPLYWDSNGADPGAGINPFGTWNTDAFWSTSANGDVATGAWIDGRTAVFSAGNDASSAFSVNVSGNVTVSGIVVEEGGVTLSGGTVTLANEAVLGVADGLHLDLNPVVAGTVGLTKTGAGIVRLNTANTFTGSIRIQEGILSIPSDDRLGPVPVSPTPDAIIMEGGVLQWTATANLTMHANRGILLNTNATFDQPVLGPPATMRIDGVISGPHAIAKTGIGVLALGGANTFTGGTDFYEGRLNPVAAGCLGTGPLRARTNVTTQVGLGGSVPVTNAIILDPDSRLHLLTGSPLTLSGPISGAGGLLRDNTGSGTTTLSGANTFSGGLTIHARQIQLAHRQALGTGVLTVGDPVSGPGTAINLQAGAALTGANALTNPVVINQNFTISGAFEMEFSGNVSLAITRTITASDAGFAKTFSGIISGDFNGFTKAGAGALVLAGSNTYSGNTTVNAGTLLVNNAAGSGTGAGDVTVNVNGTLGGSGTIAGTVTVNSGAIAPGASIGKFTVQNGLAILGGRYTWELGTLTDNATGVPGVDFDQVALTAGDFTVGGTETLMVRFPDTAVAPDRTVPFWQQPHTWTVVALSGTAANPGNAKFQDVNFLFNDAGTFSNSVAPNGDILLHFTPTDPPTPPPSVFYWDANGSGPGAGSAPGGTWGVDAFWSPSAAGDTNTAAWEEGMRAVFAAGDDATEAYTVTVSGTRSINGLTIEEGTVTFSSGTLSLDNTGGASEMAVATNLATVIGSVIAGQNDVVKTGGGSVRFNGANIYSGRTILKEGKLIVLQADQRLGTVPASLVTNAITLDGGTFSSVAGGIQNTHANRGMLITTNHGTIEATVAGGGIGVLGPITGPGSLTKTGPGTLLLGAPGDFSGGVFHQAGELRVHATNCTGTGIITVDSEAVIKTALIATGAIIPVTNNVFLTGGLAILAPGTGGSQANLEFSGIISGSGGILRSNLATGAIGDDRQLILRGNNTFSGGFKITHFSVTLGHRNALGTGPIIVGDEFADPGESVIQFIAAFDLLGANAVANPLLIQQPFSLASPVSTSALEFSGPVQLVNPNVPITANSASLPHQFSGVISSTNGYGFRKTGTGTLVLSAANTYPGGTTIENGPLAVNNTSGSGTGPGFVAVNVAGTLLGNGTVAGPVSVSGGTVSGGSSVGKLTLQSGLDFFGSGTNLWELGSLTDDSTGVAGTDFDQIAVTGGNLNLGSGGNLTLGFLNGTAPDPANAFWRAPHTWTIVQLSGGAGNPGSVNFATIANGSHAAGEFTTTVTSNGSIQLHFAPAPSVFIETISATVGSATLSWNADSGVNYRVLYNTNLNTTNWLVLTNVTGAGGLLTITDEHGGDPQRFYRLLIP